MITGIVTIAAITALVVSLNSLRSLMIVHDCHDCGDDSDSILAIVIIAILGNRWDCWRSLANENILFTDGGGKLLLTQVVSARYSIQDDGVLFLLFELCECLRILLSDY